MLKYTALPGLHGSVGIVASNVGLRSVVLTARNVDETRRWLAGQHPEARYEDRLLTSFQRQLRDYFAGASVRFDVPLDLQGVTEFQWQVLTACAQVEYGQTVTYGDLARRIGKTRAARAVGAALGRNPVPLVIPCHRVVGCGGGLGGFSAEQGIRMKRWLLDLEAGKKAMTRGRPDVQTRRERLLVNS